MRPFPPPGATQIPSHGFVEGLRLDERAIGRWAALVGVSVEQLVLAFVAGSEITTVDRAVAPQQRLVMECLLNRLPLTGFKAGFPGDPGSLFAVAVGDCGRTGPYGVDGRPFSSSRLAAGQPLLYLLDMAAGVQQQRAQGDRGERVTSFVHKWPRALAKIKTRWARIGYELAFEFPWPDGRIGAFFRPTGPKQQALERAAARAAAARARR